MFHFPLWPSPQAVERARVLTQDLQRERAERQRVQARLVAAERGAEGLQAENLRDTVAALEVSIKLRGDIYGILRFESP